MYFSKIFYKKGLALRAKNTHGMHQRWRITYRSRLRKLIFYLATLFARLETKTRIRQRDWLKLAGEKIRREQVVSVLTFLSIRANKVAKWKIVFIVQ